MVTLIQEGRIPDRKPGDHAADEPRVALVYGDYPPKLKGSADGGAEFVQRLGQGLVGRGFNVTAIVSRREDRSEAYIDAGVKVAPIVERWGLGAALGGEMGRVRRLLRAERVDVIHLVYPDPYLRYGSDSYHLPFLLKRAGLPLLVTFFGFGVTGAGAITKVGLLGLFASANSIVITDGDLLNRFRRRLPFWSRKASGGLVGSIVEDESPRWSQDALPDRQRRLGLAPDARYIGFFGFWSPDKGLEELINAVALLRMEGQQVKLVLVGGREPEHRTGYERSIIDEVRRRGIEDAVIETGPLTPREVADHLVAMDVCALPFKVNPLGRSSLALALTLGVPTIVTRPTITGELLDGLPLLDVPDAAHIIASVRSVLSDDASQLRAGAASAAAAKHWSWDSILDQYTAIYRRLAGRK